MVTLYYMSPQGHPAEGGGGAGAPGGGGGGLLEVGTTTHHIHPPHSTPPPRLPDAQELVASLPSDDRCGSSMSPVNLHPQYHKCKLWVHQVCGASWLEVGNSFHIYIKQFYLVVTKTMLGCMYMSPMSQEDSFHICCNNAR